MSRVLFAVWLSLLATPGLLGAQATLRMGTSNGPHYIGEGAVIQFVVEGFEGQSDPEVEYESITPGLRAQLAALNPQVSTFSSIINGRVSVSRRVIYKIQYHVTADEPGEYSIGPFTISQDGNQLQGQKVSFSFMDVETDPDMRIGQILPDKALYPGQRAKIGIEWWYEKSQAEDVFPPRISSLLFDQFEFIDKPPARRQPILPIETAAGQVKLGADVREEKIDGMPYLVVSAERTLIADRPGEYDLPPMSATVRKVTKWARRRGFFGGIRNEPVEDKPMRAMSEPKKLVVKPLPTDGRPQSFRGAVGSDFSIDVSANRTVVRVGDPITLSISLRGTGNIENAGLPPLSADNGLDPDSFRLPDGDVTGDFDGEAKQFQVNVRVENEGVREIPSIAYSWFDPDLESYKTARSKPIALSVGEATVVSAKDVVSSLPATTSSPTLASNGPTTEVGASSPADSSVGADLSISTDQSVLQSVGVGSARWLQAALYVCGVLALAVAVWDRRRRDVDPVVANRRAVVRRQRQVVRTAAAKPRREAARAIADALRALIAEMPSSHRESAEKLIAQCESIVYEPDAAGSGMLDPQFVTNVQGVVDQFIKDAE